MRRRSLRDGLLLGGTALVLALAVSAPAPAVLIASGDGTGNTSAPADDPGWAHVGRRGSLTAVYVRNGWVVTAAHVGVGSVILDGVTYEAIPESVVGFQHAPGVLADLIAFKLREDPGLPALAIASAPPASGTDVVMIGRGRNRGGATTWSGVDGWLWGTGATIRWGTNRIQGAPLDVVTGSRTSRSLATEFTDSPPSQVTAHEAQAATGDSGGALFAKIGGSWQLAGVLFAIAGYNGQPASTALFGNVTYAVDLSFYRGAILNVVTQPACDDGLDDDGDGLVDFPADPGCASAGDLDERSPTLPCDDGVDGDGDGFVDFPADPGCEAPDSPTESPACQDGVDNDGKPGIDFDGGASANGGVPLDDPDPECKSPSRNNEAPSCGVGAELLALAPLLAWRRRRRTARHPR